MAELNRQQHQLLSGVWNDSVFFGGIINALGGLYVPGVGDEGAGDHATQLVNMLDSINRRLAGVMSGYVYKDSDDADAQFSVKPFTIRHRGLICDYAGATALGPLATGTQNIWADLDAAPTITIGFGSAWPTTPHLTLAVIDMPVSGSWLPDHFTSAIGWQAASAGGGVMPIKRTFTHQSGAGVSVATVPADATIGRIGVLVRTPFNGTAPTLEIGDAADADRLVITTDVDLTVAGMTWLDGGHDYAAQTEVLAAIAQGGSTAGDASILMEQW
jgi:hypothetical protein